jgi:O-antigen/teichoic acid export membrane protein
VPRQGRPHEVPIPLDGLDDLVRLDFKRLSLIEVSGLVSGAACSVALAIAGMDAEAIVIGTLVAAGVSSTCYLFAGGPVLPRWHGAAAREIIAFGVPSALSSLATMAHRNVDYAILAAKMSPAQVGFYWRAFQLGVEHQRKISGIMMRMALPVYSRAASIEDMRAMRSRIVRVQATVIIPLLATFIVVAPTLIPWLLGSRWAPSVLPAQILAVAGMASAVLTGLGPLMFAIGRPGALLLFNVASFPVFGLVVLVSAGSGLTAVCVGAAGFYVMQLLAAHWLLLRRLAGIPMRSVVQDVAPGIVSSVVLIGSALPATALLRDAGAPATVELVLVPVFAAAVYCVVLRGAFPAAFADFATLVRRVTGGRRWRRPSLGAAQDPSRTAA